MTKSWSQLNPDILHFGKYRGNTIQRIADYDPAYIVYVSKIIKIPPKILAKAEYSIPAPSIYGRRRYNVGDGYSSDWGDDEGDCYFNGMELMWGDG